MPKLDPKQLLRAGARYLRSNPGVVGKAAVNAAGLKLTLPLDVARYFAAKLSEGQKKAPKDLLIEARPPAIRVAASVDAMGTAIRFAASIRIAEVRIGQDELRFDIRLADLSLRLEGESDSPVATLIKSGALDLSKPGNLVNFMPKKPPMIVEAADDRIVLDLMRDKKIAENPKVRRALALITPVLTLRSIYTENDELVIALKAIPAGLVEVLAKLRG